MSIRTSPENMPFYLWSYFYDRYKITVLPEPDLQSTFPEIEISQLFNILCKKSSFGDALMMAVAEKYLSFVSTMVTWDNEHFKDNYAGKVLPESCMKNNEKFEKYLITIGCDNLGSKGKYTIGKYG